jgi:glycosyltransferase involved in cell wall biosynthesis
MSPPDISVVIPFCNEEGNVQTVVLEIADVLTRMGRAFELILVDDGSVDHTEQMLRAVAGRTPGCRVLQHLGNAGQAAALWTGLHAARGRIIVTLDGDGQNDPADVPAMIARLSGADLVVGIRQPRHDAWLRRAMSAIANGVRRRWLHDGVSDAGCALRAFRRTVIDTLIPIRSLYSFIPSCASAAGLRVVEHPVRHRPRRSGSSSYGLRTMWWRPAIDMLVLGWLRRRQIPAVVVRELVADSEQRESRVASLHERLDIVPGQQDDHDDKGEANAPIVPPAGDRLRREQDGNRNVVGRIENCLLAEHQEQ